MSQCQIVRSKNYLNLASNSINADLEKVELSRSLNSDNQSESESSNNQLDANTFSQRGSNDPIDQVDYANIGDETTSRLYENGPMIGTNQQIDLLRDLLRTERQINERKSSNNQALSNYIRRIQSEYLSLQRDLIETLELSKKIRSQKEAQIKSQENTISEKDKLIEKLKNQIDNLDESKLRSEFDARLIKQQELANLECDQLRGQIDAIDQQLNAERVNSSNLLQEFQSKLDEQQKLFDKQAKRSSDKIVQLEAEIESILQEPKNQAIRALREEKSELLSNLEETSMELNDCKAKMESFSKRIECLLNEQERLRNSSQEEAGHMHEQYMLLRRQCNQMKLDLVDREETIQIANFNLQRSERRVKNLIGALKGKEATYREVLGQMETRHEQELERLRANLKSVERKSMDQSSQLDEKQNELVRLELERDNQLESMRNDRDQRVNKLMNEKQKVERDFQALEIKYAREKAEQEQVQQTIERLRAEGKQFKEESKRLSIDLTKCEAKLFSKTRELEEAIRKLPENVEDIENRNAFQSDTDFGADEARHKISMLDKTIEMLREENKSLTVKLKISESSLAKINSAITKEQAKLRQDYEAKLESIRIEKVACEKSRAKYKRYGSKLKKYMDHLRVIHSHICDSDLCNINQPSLDRFSVV